MFIDGKSTEAYIVDNDFAESLFAKVGLLKNFFPFSKTAFSVDYTQSENMPTDDGEGNSYAVAAFQQFDMYGSEVFASYRLHSLDRGVEAETEDINVFSVGGRVKF